MTSTSLRWTPALMDALRQEGDALADAVIAHTAATGGPGALHALLQRLFNRGDLGVAGLPPEVRDYLARATAEVPTVDAERLRAAERLYARHRAEIRLVLGGYSLPAAYAARRGVQVLHRTSYLLKNPVRRLFETARFLDAVLAPGALLPGGPGPQHLARVRLAHAASRFLLLRDTARPWDVKGLGVPINQEDQAGTLMTFSYVVLEGLATLHLTLSPEEQEAWLYAWRVAGRLLGLHARLLPESVEEARELTLLIRARQIEASREGVELTASLLEGMRSLLPAPLSGLPASLVHFFLDAHEVGGQRVVDMLEVPEADWTVAIPRALRGFNGFVGWVDARAPRAGGWLREVRGQLTSHLVLEEPHGARPLPLSQALRKTWDAAFAGWGARPGKVA